MPSAVVWGLLGRFWALAPLEAPAQRQGQVASNLGLAVNQALKASTAKTANAGLSAGRSRGSVHPCAL